MDAYAFTDVFFIAVTGQHPLLCITFSLKSTDLCFELVEVHSANCTFITFHACQINTEFIIIIVSTLTIHHSFAFHSRLEM